MKVLKVTEHKDGTTTIDFEITKDEKEIFKRVYKKKRFYPNLVRQALYEGIDIMLHEIACKKGGK